MWEESTSWSSVSPEEKHVNAYKKVSEAVLPALPAVFPVIDLNINTRMDQTLDL